MNSRQFASLVPTLAMLAVCTSPAANATLNMRTQLQSIAQIGNGSTAVSLGHTVIAGTNMNRLIAGGTFNASCASTYTGSIPGSRTLPSDQLLRYNQLYVTIPEWLPAVMNMPGFESVPSGSILSCTYAWTSRAQESTYTFGTGGSSTIGGEELSDGGSVGFYMYKTDGDGEPSRGCLH